MILQQSRDQEQANFFKEIFMTVEFIIRKKLRINQLVFKMNLII